jgi:hypothetical protein
MAKLSGKSQAAATHSESFTRVADRHVVSEPDRVIQVERVRVSQEQQTSVNSAIRAGRQAAGKSE